MKRFVHRLVNATSPSSPAITQLVRLVAFAPLLAVTMAVGPCGGEPLGSTDGGSHCTYQGKAFASGATFTAADGCNSCSCGADGTVACTTRACLDAGADVTPYEVGGTCFDASGNAVNCCTDPATGKLGPCGGADAGMPVCKYGGAVYTSGTTFRSTDGCNTCTCNRDGSVACTTKACLDAGTICSDAVGNPVPCCTDSSGKIGACPNIDGGATTCTYGGKAYPVGATFPATDGCNTCSCQPDGTVPCTLRACVDAGSDSCTYAGKPYPVGATFPATDGCNTCSCTTTGTVCTKVACRDAGGITGVCSPGKDQTCNEDPSVSSLRGKCQADGSCACGGAGTSGGLSPYTGKCLAPDDKTGDGCEMWQKLFPVGATFPCADNCSTCLCAGPGKIEVTGNTCVDAGVAPCALDAIYVYGNVGGLVAYQDQTTLSPGTGSARSTATYVRTRVRFDGTSGSSCAPGLPTCGDPALLDMSDIMTDILNPVVQKYLSIDPSNIPFLGYDSRPVDGTAFSFMRGDGHGLLVGGPCRSDTSNCNSIPPEIDKLVQDLRTLDAQQVRSPSCAGLQP